MSILRSFFKKQELMLGDRIKISGGHMIGPEWLNGEKACYGKIIKFIPGRYKGQDIVVELENEISTADINGKVLVLTLRYKDASWRMSGIVHLHLFNEVPDVVKWCNDSYIWDVNHIESNASYRRIKKYETLEKNMKKQGSRKEKKKKVPKKKRKKKVQKKVPGTF